MHVRHSQEYVLILTKAGLFVWIKHCTMTQGNTGGSLIRAQGMATKLHILIVVFPLHSVDLTCMHGTEQ